MNVKLKKSEPKPPVIITHKPLANCEDCGCVRYDWVGRGYMGFHKMGCSNAMKQDEMKLMMQYDEVRFG